MKPFKIHGEILSERSRRNLFILETIRKAGSISKADISRISGVNVVSISNYIEKYIQNNLVRVKSLDVSAGGRRPALLALNSQANLAVGVGLNLIDTVGLVIDSKGQVVTRVVKKRPRANVKNIMSYTFGLIEAVLDKLSSVDQKKIRGIGVGIAGIIDHQNGTLNWPQKLDNGTCQYTSLYIPLKDMIERKFKVRCFLENDATMACMGEQWTTPNSSIDHLIYLFSGVGCGLMINGEVYRGASGSAGEISLASDKITKYLPDGVRDVFFLTPWEDDLGMVSDARQLLKTSRPNLLTKLTGGNEENLNLSCVFKAAQDGDEPALEIVRKAGYRLGLKAAFLVNFLNPQMVIIGGGLEEGGTVFLDAVRTAVSDLAFSEMANAVKIIPSRLGCEAVALGAASLVIREVFAQG